MIKKIILITVIICSSTNIQAQDATVNWSKQLLLDNKKDGRPTEVIGSNASSTFILFEDLKQKGKKHLSISSFDKETMSLQKTVDLLQLFPTVKDFKFQLMKFGNEKIYITWLNDASKIREVYAVVLNSDFSIASKLKKIQSEGLNRGKEDAKVASFTVLINPSIKEAPICIVLEKNAALNEVHQSVATQFNASLEQVTSLPVKLKLVLDEQRSLFTGQDKLYNNIFNYVYLTTGVYGSFDTYELGFKGNELPFVHFNFKTKKAITKTIKIGNASTGDLVITETEKGARVYLLNKQDDSYTNPSGKGLMVIEFNDGLSSPVIKEIDFTTSLLKSAFSNYEYLISKKGLRKLGSSKPLTGPASLHPYTKIEDVITTKNGDFISLSFYYYKTTNSGNKHYKKGLLLVNISPDGKLNWLKNFERFYENKSEREGTFARDSKLLLKNNQLVCAYFTDVDLKGEKLDKSLVNNSFNVIFINAANGELIKSIPIIVNNKKRKGTFVAKGLGLKKENNNIYFFGQPKAKDVAGGKVFGNKKGRIGIIKLIL